MQVSSRVIQRQPQILEVLQILSCWIPPQKGGIKLLASFMPAGWKDFKMIYLKALFLKEAIFQDYVPGLNCIFLYSSALQVLVTGV